jgi:aminoglycoside N3'-acetyltransferase
MLIMELFNIPHDIQNVLIHTDVLRGIKFPMKNRSSFLESHHEFLIEFTQEKPLFFPGFNYTCLKTGKYSVKNDEVQVGVLNERIRGKNLYNRDLTPVFNFLSNSKEDYTLVENNDTIDPFGFNSTFDFLFNNNSYLLHYGSSFNTSTIIHYIERISGKLSYRYDKQFSIEIVDDQTIKNVRFNYHVRPLNYNLVYDWIKLETDLKSDNLLNEYKNGRTQILGVKINDLVKYWLDKLNEDPLYFLDQTTKYNVSKKLDELGGKFELKHFE